jgi:diacylglycerol diphosphate phosphatase/phosphatidate phosphatase
MNPISARTNAEDANSHSQVYHAPPAPTRTFPLTSWHGKLYYPQFALPMRSNIIPIWLAALLASVIPISIILWMQTGIRSFWDANNAIMGLLYSLINAAVFQVFLKWLIGGLSPHFFSACDAKFNGWGSDYGTGVIQVMRNRTICRGDEKEINEALESFPSGHATAACTFPL